LSRRIEGSPPPFALSSPPWRASVEGLRTSYLVLPFALRLAKGRLGEQHYRRLPARPE